MVRRCHPQDAQARSSAGTRRCASAPRSLLDDHGADATRIVLDRFRHEAPDSAIYHPIFAFSLLYELLARQRTADARALYPLYRACHPDLADRIQAIGERFPRARVSELRGSLLRRRGDARARPPRGAAPAALIAMLAAPQEDTVFQTTSDTIALHDRPVLDVDGVRPAPIAPRLTFRVGGKPVLVFDDLFTEQFVETFAMFLLRQDYRPRPSFDNELSAAMTADLVWNEAWGGETVFCDRAAGAGVCVSPRPGRLVLFPAAIHHRAGVPARDCPTFRYGLSLFYRCPRMMQRPVRRAVPGV